MSMVLLRFLALTLAPALTSTARPGLTFFAVQITVAALVHRDMAALPDSLVFLISAPAMAAMGVITILELLARHDPDVAAILRDLQLDRIAAAAGALSAALLFAALGMSESQAMALAGDEAAMALGSEGMLAVAATAATAEQAPLMQGGLVVVAVILNLGLTWLRSQWLLFVDDFDLSQLWARLESGGVIAALILLPLFPLIVLAILVAFAVLLCLVSMVARAATQAWDQHLRTACGECGQAIREEASLCPVCGVEREPSKRSVKGVRAAIGALRTAKRKP